MLASRQWGNPILESFICTYREKGTEIETEVGREGGRGRGREREGEKDSWKMGEPNLGMKVGTDGLGY